MNASEKAVDLVKKLLKPLILLSIARVFLSKNP